MRGEIILYGTEEKCVYIFKNESQPMFRNNMSPLSSDSKQRHARNKREAGSKHVSYYMALQPRR
jgi:hypothetical protein